MVLIFQVTGLKYGTKYNYRVFAENAAGLSDPSNTIGPLLADDVHGQNHCLHLFIFRTQELYEFKSTKLLIICTEGGGGEM